MEDSDTIPNWILQDIREMEHLRNVRAIQGKNTYMGNQQKRRRKPFQIKSSKIAERTPRRFLEENAIEAQHGIMQPKYKSGRRIQDQTSTPRSVFTVDRPQRSQTEQGRRPDENTLLAAPPKGTLAESMIRPRTTTGIRLREAAGVKAARRIAKLKHQIKTSARSREMRELEQEQWANAGLGESLIRYSAGENEGESGLPSTWSSPRASFGATTTKRSLYSNTQRPRPVSATAIPRSSGMTSEQRNNLMDQIHRQGSGTRLAQAPASAKSPPQSWTHNQEPDSPEVIPFFHYPQKKPAKPESTSEEDGDKDEGEGGVGPGNNPPPVDTITLEDGGHVRNAEKAPSSARMMTSTGSKGSASPRKQQPKPPHGRPKRSQTAGRSASSALRIAKRSSSMPTSKVNKQRSPRRPTTSHMGVLEKRPGSSGISVALRQLSSSQARSTEDSGPRSKEESNQEEVHSKIAFTVEQAAAIVAKDARVGRTLSARSYEEKAARAQKVREAARLAKKAHILASIRSTNERLMAIEWRRHKLDAQKVHLHMVFYAAFYKKMKQNLRRYKIRRKLMLKWDRAAKVIQKAWKAYAHRKIFRQYAIMKQGSIMMRMTMKARISKKKTAARLLLRFLRDFDVDLSGKVLKNYMYYVKKCQRMTRSWVQCCHMRKVMLMKYWERHEPLIRQELIDALQQSKEADQAATSASLQRIDMNLYHAWKRVNQDAQHVMRKAALLEHKSQQLQALVGNKKKNTKKMSIKDPINTLVDKKIRREIIDHSLRQKRILHCKFSHGIRTEIEKDAFTVKDVQRMMSSQTDEEHIVRVMYKNRKYWPPLLILTDPNLGHSWKAIIAHAVVVDLKKKFAHSKLFAGLDELLSSKVRSPKLDVFFDSRTDNGNYFIAQDELGEMKNDI